jgi:hypothetical protein
MLQDACPVRKRSRTVHNGANGKSQQVEDWPWLYADYIGPKPDRRAYAVMGIESQWISASDYPVFNGNR